MPYVLSAMRTTLAELDREVGGTAGVSRRSVDELGRLRRRVEQGITRVAADLKPRMTELLDSTQRVELALRMPDSPVPSKPVLGVLPLARVIPQDVHSAMDYGAALMAGAGALTRRASPNAKMASVALCAGGLGVALATDYRLSAVKVIPIETHEKIDYAWSLTAIAAPFVLGYGRSSPLAAMLHVAAGVGTILSSLFTDYRASRGLVAPKRSRGGPSSRPASLA